MSSNKCVKLLILCLIITLSVSLKPAAKRRKLSIPKQRSDIHNFTREKHILLDLPVKKDVAVYLRSLNRIINFCLQNKNDIDLNFAFGLFLINVNLKSVMKQKNSALPLHVMKALTDITTKNDNVLKHFRMMVKNDNNKNDLRNKQIYSLFSNESVWIKRIENFDMMVAKTRRRQHSPDELERVYQKWETYLSNVDNLNGAVPDTHQSDLCISSLAKNSVRNSEYSPTCSLADSCYNILVNGTDYGYALTHRLLLLLVARYGRGCSIFSPTTDRELASRYCTAAYSEAEYIAQHGFHVMDLFMEQIAFCAINGHIEFLQRSWVNRILQLQMAMGCFYDEKQILLKPGSLVITKWNDQHHITSRVCAGHLTATSAAAISTALRYILQINKYRPNRRVLQINK